METIITFSIVGIFLALTWATVNFLMIKSNDQIVRTRAHFLAMEGVELTKQIRQTAVNRNREYGFSASIGNKDGAYIITPMGDAFTLQEGENEVIEMNEEPFIDYCRTIYISGDSDDVKKVISAVRWGGYDCMTGEKEIVYSTYLANLNK